MDTMLIIRMASLFVLLWFGAVLVTSLARGQSTNWANYAVPSAAVVVFTWSMGWLT